MTAHACDRIALAWTGASGAKYGLRLLQQVLESGATVELLISKAAQIVVAEETGLTLPGQAEGTRQALVDHLHIPAERLHVYGREQWTAPMASGSNAPRAMVICPCTSGTAAAIAQGSSTNLIERAVDVMLKERRQLILVPRETPLSAIQLENLTKLAQVGVTILPANPGWYHHPQTVQEIVDFVVARIMDHLGLPQSLVPRWGEVGYPKENG